MRQLIINADDFGLHELINEGIIESHLDGCVTSTTIIAGGSAFEHAVMLARQCPTLGVGVHLTLIGAKPVARADVHTLLTSDGNFYPTYKVFALRYALGLISQEHIEYELRCQMQKIAGSGIRITHLDSHQHLHTLPGMARIISKIAKEFQVGKIRIPDEPVCYMGTGKLSVSRMFARTILTGCASLARYQYKKQGLYSPSHFYGMLSGGAISTAEIYHIIRNLPDGVSELMVHPGKNTEVLHQQFRWAYHWHQEMQALKSKDVKDIIQKSNIQLINYRQLLEERQ